MGEVIKKDILEELSSLGISAARNFDISKRSYIGIGALVSFWCEMSSRKELSNCISVFKESHFPYLVAGRLSNTLFPDKAAELAVISLQSGEFAEITLEREYMICGAGVSLARAIRKAYEAGLSGLEDWVGIPASCGGAVAMNASGGKELAEIIDGIEVLDVDGNIRWLSSDELVFSYRTLNLKEKIVLAVRFKLLKDAQLEIGKRLKKNITEKMKKQPLAEKSLGCTFKNPPRSKFGAGELLDRCGLRGMVYGEAMFSERHANFIINLGKAKSADVLTLIELGKQKVREDFGFELEEEIKVVDVG